MNAWRAAVLRAVPLAMLAATASNAADEPPAAVRNAWTFEATLDGKPIGEHRYTLTQSGDTLALLSEARFDISFFGITAYRYRHRTDETWRGGCLGTLKAVTDDDGKQINVTARRQGEALEVDAAQGRHSVSGCVMSYAYWNPALQKQSHLLNPQTGQYDSVTFTPLGDGPIDVRGRQVMAQHVRIAGPERPIDLWYSSEGEWLALDATVAGGRKLSYRLK